LPTVVFFVAACFFVAPFRRFFSASSTVLTNAFFPSNAIQTFHRIAFFKSLQRCSLGAPSGLSLLLDHCIRQPRTAAPGFSRLHQNARWTSFADSCGAHWRTHSCNQPLEPPILSKIRE